MSKTTSQQACGFSGALDPTWLGGEGSRARRWYGWPPRQVCRPPAVHARGRTAQRAVGPGGPRPPGPEGGPPAREALRGAGRPPVTLRPRPPRSLRQEVLQRCSVLLVKRGHMANEAVTLHLGAAAFSQAQQCKVGVSRVLRKHPELKSHLALHKLVVKPSKRGRQDDQHRPRASWDVSQKGIDRLDRRLRRDFVERCRLTSAERPSNNWGRLARVDKRHELEGSPLERFFAEVETCLREAPSVWVTHP